MIIQDHINGRLIKEVRTDIVYKGIFRNAGDATDWHFVPVFSTIGGVLNQSIIRTCIKDIGIDWGLTERRNSAEFRHSIHIPSMIPTLIFTHDGLRNSVSTGSKISGNRRPGISSICRFPYSLRSKINGARYMLTWQNRRIPVETLLAFISPWLWLDIHRFTGDSIQPVQISLLRFSISNIWISWFYGRLMSVPTQHS